MNKKVLQTLEYNKIIDLLIESATTNLGKEKCRNLVPFTNLDDIKAAQQNTSDALLRIIKSGSISFLGTKDIRTLVTRLKLGASLGIAELLSISSILNVAAKVKAYDRNLDDDKYDSLSAMFSSLEPLTPLNTELKRCILSEDEISDDASSGLKQVRKNIKLLNDKIHTQLNSILNSSRNYLQDAVITMRNGRYCFPVKQEYKSNFTGMIHDKSSTGSTLFIEPMSIVALNNELRELEIKELKEIEVILANLSNLSGEHCEELINNFYSLSELDFIFAKASLSKKFRASEPIFNTKGYINIKKGRHPLLDNNNVVPIDIHLGKDFNLLIVTGPNTGGKTVALKTIGLFTLIGQAGLHIPAFDKSELAVFENVFADIGDEQSIEQNLSTFSSHMTNIVHILANVTDNSLCLFDELGAGTDPTEGAALAMSILLYLHKRNIRTMATTHYSELKVFALSTAGVENACCEFDIASLCPTYRLLIGIAGKSNAFAISKKLGLPDFIIDSAKDHMNDADESFEDLLTNLEESRLVIEKEREEIASYKKEISILKSRLEDKHEKWDERKEKAIRNSNEEAARILRQAKEYADKTIRNINRLADSTGVNKALEAERTKLREELDNKEKKLALKNKKSTAHKSPNPKTLRLGDGIRVLSLNLTGTISSLPNAKGDLYVQMGILRSLVNINDLELINDTPANTKNNNTTKSAGSGKIKMSKSSGITTEINLIGMTTDEAIPIMEKYLDDAYLSHLSSVRVVHGRGTGALRNAVHKQLKKLKYIKTFRLGEFGEGDTGVTIVEFN
jgi:MutS2 family protein